MLAWWVLVAHEFVHPWLVQILFALGEAVDVVEQLLVVGFLELLTIDVRVLLTLRRNTLWGLVSKRM